jgi:multidrug efflux pump subunit AcrA (membrane-fusion protein)
MGADLEKLRLNLPSDQASATTTSAGPWKWVSLALAVVLVAFVIFHFASRSGGPTGIEIKTWRASSTGGGKQAFSAGGWIEPEFPYPVVVSALVSGRIEEMRVVESSPVAKGEVIAVLYKKDFQDAVTKAEAELDFAKARLSKLETGFRVEEVEEAKAKLKEFEAEEEYQKTQWERSEELVKQGVISRQEADKELALYKTSQARTESARQALKLKEAGYRTEEVEEARAEVQKNTALLDLARAQLSYTEIKAPVAGKILELHVEQGDSVTAEKSNVVSIYDPGKMQVRVDVRQENISKVRLDQRAYIRTEARKTKPYEGKVIRIDPKANLARDTIRVKVLIEKPDELLHPEMTAAVDFAEGEREGPSGLTIPKSAIISDKEDHYVFRIWDGRANRIRIELGDSSGDTVAVTSGLSEGDEVAVTQVGQLEDGAKVQIIR